MADYETRNLVQNPRFGFEEDGTLSPHIQDPGPLKDTGWIPNVSEPAEGFFNWTTSALGYFVLYLESVLGKMFRRNHLLRSGFGTTVAEVSPGAALAVDVVGAYAWIDGAQVFIPGVADLALQTADPNDPRIDVIVAQVTTGPIPAYAVVTGTPDPNPVAPAIGSNQVAVAEVSVGPAQTAVGSLNITDRRVFGAMGMSEIVVDRFMSIGDNATPMLTVDADAGIVQVGTPRIADFDQAAGIMRVGRGTTLLAADVINDILTLHRDQVRTSARIERKVDVQAFRFRVIGTGAATEVIVDNEIRVTDSIDQAIVELDLPQGWRIDEITLYANKVALGSQLQFELARRDKSDNGKHPIIIEATTAGGTGYFSQSFSADQNLPHDITQNVFYQLTISGNGGGETIFHGADLRISTDNPFNSL